MEQDLRRNVKLTIEYDGTAYHGWQRQPSAPTIQQALEEGIERIAGHRVTLIGSGRTDAGVHALGQVANFHTSSRIPAGQFHLAINSAIPNDIAVLRAEDVPADFHAQYSAKSKTYRYSLVCREVRPALGGRYVHWIKWELDVERMRAGAAHFVGEHDFSTFETESSREGSVRTVSRFDIEEAGERVEFHVTSNGFVYNMVRAMVGTLIEVGSGKRPPEQVAELLAVRDRRLAGPTAPAKGLCLVRVEY